MFRHWLARRAIEHEIPVGRSLRVAPPCRGRTTEATPGIDPARIAHHAERGGDDATLAWAAAAACRLAVARWGGTREELFTASGAMAVGDPALG